LKAKSSDLSLKHLKPTERNWSIGDLLSAKWTVDIPSNANGAQADMTAMKVKTWMLPKTTVRVLSLLLVFLTCPFSGNTQTSHPFQPTSNITAPRSGDEDALHLNDKVLIASSDEFRQAIKRLGGTETVVNFDELDAKPVTNYLP
jgi:hypothetical protein